MATLSDINQGIISKVTSGTTIKGLLNGVGYLIIGFLVIAGAGWWAWTYFDKKKYNRIVKAHEIINGYFVHTYTDLGRPVKIGKGGFEVIYLKKLKTWKLGHGARSGRNEYNFYIMPDGYWYPGLIKAEIYFIDKLKGMLPVVTTNPAMRSQYTSLEKQIDTLHAEKKSFWKEYGPWILGAVYIAIIGIFSWLSYKEIGQFLGSGTNLANQMNLLAENMNRLAVNLNGAGSGGLVPAK